MTLPPAPSAERFERNLAALAIVAPAFHQRMAGMQAPNGKIVPQPGDPTDLNLEFDGQLLYPGQGMRRMARLQVEAYCTAPARLTAVAPPRNGMVQDVTDLMRAPVDAFIAGRGPAPAVMGDNRGAALIAFGIGLGEHVTLLFEHLRFRHLVLIEPFVELIWHSLWLQDWVAWLEQLAARGGSIHLMTGDDAAAIAAELKDHLNRHCHGTLHGSYFYRHYESIPLDQCREQVAREFQSLFFNTRGFFEDQIMMLVNATRNLRRGTDKLVMDFPLPPQQVPAIVVAAGPSLDKSLPDLLRLRDQAVVFCAGSTLGTLLRHGIVPDFQCDIENTTENYDCITWAAELGDITPVRLLASATVDPRMAGLFDETLFYIRDQMVTAELYGGLGQTIHGTAPNCLTLALRMAIHFGFQEIYLFGTDFGSRRPDQHHVSDSIWMTDPEWRSRYDAIPDPMTIVKPANFGGRCYTNRLLHDYLRYTEDIIGAFGHVQVFNCSDGLRVAGATGRLAGQVRLATPREERELAISLITATAVPTDDMVDPAQLHEFQAAYRAWTDDLKTQVAAWCAERGDLVALHDMLLAALAPEDGIIAALAHGSLLTMFQYAFHYGISWHLDGNDDFRDAVAAAARNALDSMRHELDDAIAAALSDGEQAA